MEAPKEIQMLICNRTLCKCSLSDMKMQEEIYTKLSLLFIVVLFNSCATYYQIHYDFHRHFESGRLEEALKYLDSNKRAARGKDRFLYYVDKATVCNMLGKTSLSLEYFRQADLYIEDFQKNYGTELVALFTNPMIKPYKPEDFENVLIQYYQAKNFLSEKKFDAALIETRRLNEKLLVISDKHKKHITYKHDAFGHLLMGLIYDANNDANNAFIAYRNAYKIYVDEYSKYYGVQAPEQLKKDILRTAARTGLWDEVNYYERLWQMSYRSEEIAPNDGQVILFWHNGLGPVKSEWSINFTILPAEAGFVTFVSDEWGMQFPFYVENADDRRQLTDMKFIRVAVPRFVERKNVYQQGIVSVAGRQYFFELAQDIHNIATQNLKDRIWRELGTALLRMALKQSAETALRRSDKKRGDSLGFALSIVNALTEKADTRNWQTLPHDIYYTRINLPAGDYEFSVHLTGKVSNDTKRFQLKIKPNETVFHTVYSIDALKPY